MSAQMKASAIKSVAKGEALLEVRNLKKYFPVTEGIVMHRTIGNVKAVDNVSFTIARGETLGLVGESGCGKTTLGRMLVRLLDPTEGTINFEGSDMAHAEGEELKRLRQKVQIIFQDPFSSLDPRSPVGNSISEGLKIHGIGDEDERHERVLEMLDLVGLEPYHSRRFPHEFSGGQRQRIGIARALILKPDFVVADEPVSALDVSVQAQVLNLLKDLQERFGLTYLFISHNLAVVDYMADRIAVMCAGYLVEMAPREVLFRNPVHPYTKALLAAVPRPDPGRKLDLSALMEGKVSSPAAWEAPFGVTDDERPELIDIGEGHYVRAAHSLLTQV